MKDTVAIFCHGQLGDCGTISSVLPYREQLWGDAKLIWYIADENRDLLAHQDIELRTFPRGFGHPELTISENKKLIDAGKEPVWEDWAPLVDENNHLNLELKKNYPSLADVTRGYFPAPHQMPVKKRHGLPYTDCSKKVFGVDPSLPWHPYLLFSEQERERANEFMRYANGGKRILIESFAGSSQSLIDEQMISKAMSICNAIWGNCNFIFASHKFLRHKEQFPLYMFDSPGMFSCADFTVRQCALIAGQCDLIISASSGITVAASCWDSSPTPIIQFCGSEICGTRHLALGEYHIVTADHKSLPDAKEEFYNVLTNFLNTHQ